LGRKCVDIFFLKMVISNVKNRLIACGRFRKYASDITVLQNYWFLAFNMVKSVKIQIFRNNFFIFVSYQRYIYILKLILKMFKIWGFSRLSIFFSDIYNI
jgi:hypothetical protein